MEPPTSAPGPLRRHDLRQLLRAVLPTDSDFSAFCLDFFPTVAERFANGMDRLAKATLLLELAPPSDLVAALRQHAPDRLAQYEVGRASIDSTKRNPYRGLSAFQLDEAHLFFGRETLTASLWQRFEALYEKPDATRLLAIVGPSGSGKSSVARAGLLASLAQSPIPGPRPMRFAIVKPGERPIESLARALVPLLPADSSVLPAKRQVAIEDLLRDDKVPGKVCDASLRICRTSPRRRWSSSSISARSFTPSVKNRRSAIGSLSCSCRRRSRARCGCR